MAFINNEDENIRNTNINKRHITYGLTKGNCDYYATNIEITEQGSEFDIYFKNEMLIHIKTKLLGENNIINIIAAVAIAKELDLSNEQIKLGVRLLKPIPHRLELIKGENGTIVIDDAFNANVKGTKTALNVLSKFNGRKKILITPGMVELGEKQEEYNKEFGKQASSCADYVILVGKKQAEPILKGLKEEKYPENQIYIAENLEEAIAQMNKIITKDSVILFENDLPDNYL